MALSTNLVSYWKLDEGSGNAADSVASNTLTNNGTVTFGAAKINNGATFNGTTQYLSIADGSQVGLSVTSDFSISCWINFSSYSSSTGYVYAGKFNLDTGARSYLFCQNVTASNKLDAVIYTASGDFRFGVAWTPSTSTWYHIVLVYTASSHSVDFYVNGSQQGASQTGFGSSVDASAATFALGGGTGSTSPQMAFPGKMDEVGFWSRALLSGEVTSLYNGGSGLAYPFPAGGSSGSSLTMMGVGS